MVVFVFINWFWTCFGRSLAWFKIYLATLYLLSGKIVFKVIEVQILIAILLHIFLFFWHRPFMFCLGSIAVVLYVIAFDFYLMILLWFVCGGLCVAPLVSLGRPHCYSSR